MGSTGCHRCDEIVGDTDQQRPCPWLWLLHITGTDRFVSFEGRLIAFALESDCRDFIIAARRQGRWLPEMIPMAGGPSVNLGDHFCLNPVTLVFDDDQGRGRQVGRAYIACRLPPGQPLGRAKDE